MARRRSNEPTLPEDFEERIVDIDVEEEMQGAFLEYAYSVIYSRALPDARDGLKPVQRRILYTMDQMRIRPDVSHVKCSRVVGQVMGLYHPHGDSAIYDALVRLGQPFSEPRESRSKLEPTASRVEGPAQGGLAHRATDG